MLAHKKIVLVNRKPPFGTSYAHEALSVALATAAFIDEVFVCFIEDGVFQLLPNTESEKIGLKNFVKTFQAFGDFGIESLYLSDESLKDRLLAPEDLIKKEMGKSVPNIVVVKNRELVEKIAESDVCFSF